MGPISRAADAADRVAKRGFAAPGEPGHPATPPVSPPPPPPLAPELPAAPPVPPELVEREARRALIELRLRCIEAVVAVRFVMPSAAALVAAAAELEHYVIEGAPAGVTQS